MTQDTASNCKQRVQQFVRDHIRSQTLAAGAAIPSNRELMRRLGVSQTTVTSALRSLVARGELVRQPGRTLTVAASSQQTKGTVAVVVPATILNYYLQMIDGLEEVLTAQGYQLAVVSQRRFFPADSREVFARLARQNLRAVVLTVMEDVDALQAFKRECPDTEILLLDCSADGPFHEAPTDNFEGGRLVGRHLLTEGCRRAVFAGSMDGPAYTCGERLRGLQAAWREAGLPEDSITLIRDTWSREQAYRCMADYLTARGLCFDAVFAYMDLAAAGVCECLLDRKIAVPEQVKVVGFSNLVETADCPIPLTTVDQQIGGLARQGAQELVRALESSCPRLVRLVRPVSLIVRQSSSATVPLNLRRFDVPPTMRFNPVASLEPVAVAAGAR